MQYSTPAARYAKNIASPEFTEDAAQAVAVEHLQGLYDRLMAPPAKRGVYARLKQALTGQEDTSNGVLVKGLYFWGGVGRGKTYLMDLFYDSLPFERKLRTHFHRFMRSVHHELRSLEGQQDPLERIAERFAERYRVICFDEFFVVDITDAMILANLLDGLFSRGVTLVATSNIVPAGLYENGLQRARFLPAIALLEQHTEIVNVDGGTDYRLRALTQSDLYYAPLDSTAEAAMAQCFSALTQVGEHVQSNIDLEIESRLIRVIKQADGVLWCDFMALCDGPRSQNDYIELAREFSTVLVSGVPIFTEATDDQARRFIYLVDEFYDRNVKLVISAQAHFSCLYQSGRLAFEFQRTESRLQEMQSETYLTLPHKG